MVNNIDALPFEEKLVIRAVLTAGEPARHIYISRTIPILDELTDSAFAVYDAQGSILHQGVEYPLVLQQERSGSDSTQSVRRSIYEARGLVIQEAERYDIIVQWNGKTATASTLVPRKPALLDASLLAVPRTSITTATTAPGEPPTLRLQTDTTLVAEIQIQPSVRTVYSASLQIVSTATAQIDTLVALTPAYLGEPVFINTAQNSQLHMLPSYILTSGALPAHTQKLLNHPSARAQIVVYAFDEPYYRYALTRSRGREAANPLGTAGENVAWNVQGDGIGLFIGVASVQHFVVR